MNATSERVEAVSDDDTVLEPIDPEAPPGWVLLPAGVSRKVRVIQHGLAHADHKCFLVDGLDGRAAAGFEVKVLGPVRLVRTVENPDSFGCGTGRAWLETDAAVLVRQVA